MSVTEDDNLFARGMNPYQRMIHSKILDHLAQGFAALKQPASPQRNSGNSARVSTSPESQGCEYLSNSILSDINTVNEAAQRLENFQRLYRISSSEAEQQQTILDFAEQMGASARDLAGDAAAFQRWFEFDAVVERHTRRTAETEQRIAFSLERLGALSLDVLQQTHPDEIAVTWKELNTERLVRRVLTLRFDHRVHLSAYRCLTIIISALPRDQARKLLRVDMQALANRTSLDRSNPTWTQCEAADLLCHAAPDSFAAIATKRLTEPDDGDDLFVRRRIARAIAETIPTEPALKKLIPHLFKDRSEFVRQVVGRILVKLDADEAINGLRTLALDDDGPRVRAAALVEGAETIARPELHLPFLNLIADVLERDTDPFVIRTAMHITCVWIEGLRTVESNAGSVMNRAGVEVVLTLVEQRIQPQLRRIRETSDSIPMRRFAAQSHEKLWLYGDAEALRLAQQLKVAAGAIDSGSSRRIPRHICRDKDDNLIGRVLAVLAQEDFAYELLRGRLSDRVTRGYLFRFRFWRFLYEMSTPSPDKRQAFGHTIGRASFAWLRAPSGILAELSETKVPGEPLFISDEGGWRPFIPLPDDVLSALNQFGTCRPVKFYTAEGITTLLPPRWFVQRAWAWIRLTVQFPRYARLRNWGKDSPNDPDAFLKAMHKLGVRVSFCPYDSKEEPVADETVTRFFPNIAAAAAVLATGIPDWLREFKIYFTSVYENSLAQLLVFTVGFSVFFFLKHLFSNMSLRRRRNQICMSIGGWGTRGKSGTERLKAALLNSLGYSITSKSSGCEAMFLYAPTYGRLREYILYRPYDKATIWEHRNVIIMAAKLNSQMFIWECMGLTPAYVDVLQKQWTRDDLNTITNTFPDHEDLQGPAGINVAETISGFVAKDSVVITTEQQMRPILTEAARQLQSQLIGVGWLESGLLTDDVLERFPYTEHPDNIALVQRMAIEMGIDPDYSVKQMSDQMIPDLGVLLTSPPAPLRSRELIFTNGMSANERLGCMGNWDRLGFRTQSHVDEPHVWISTVVNNRADRIARSHVFARILVQDVQADRHFLIGNNLKGLLGYIQEAWQEYVVDITLWKEAGDKEVTAVSTLDRMASRFRQYTSAEQIQFALTRILARVLPDAKSNGSPEENTAVVETAALWQESDAVLRKLQTLNVDDALAQDLVRFVKSVTTGFQEYSAFRDRIQSCAVSERRAVTADFHELLWTWYERKLVVVEDYYSTGEQVVNRIANETPPGVCNRIIGLQNIKGTGLDFVYRWQAWQTCHEICEQVGSTDVVVSGRGIKQLAEFQDYGLLSEEYVRNALAIARASEVARRESTRAQLDIIELNLDNAMKTINASLGGGQKKSGVMDVLIGWLEEFMDVNDAIRRRKESDVVYKDLAKERISQERAILELRAINKRQKGGWVSKRLQTLFGGGEKAA